jgi:hypothetical protein
MRTPQQIVYALEEGDTRLAFLIGGKKTWTLKWLQFWYWLPSLRVSFWGWCWLGPGTTTKQEASRLRRSQGYHQ